MQYGVAKIEQLAIERADQIVTVSEYMAHELQSEWAVPKRKISVVQNGFFPEQLESFKNVSIVEGRVCFLGTLHPKVDVEAIKEVCQLPSVTEMIVIGDGAQRDRLEKLALKYDNLRVTGRLPDSEAFKLLASAAIAINPQHQSELQRSSSPVKLYYYAALGKPMVVTAGPPLVTELSEAGAAVATESREEFLENVEAVMTRSNLAADLRKSALAESDAFRWDSRVNEVVKVYE
jgi:glycosyltransferase involved in cell wall biosynthesis